MKTLICCTITTLLGALSATAQDTGRMTRLARIEVDSAHIVAYKALLKEEIEASIRLEPGVITLYAVQEKERPTQFTILEVYASQAAYRSHIETPHFKKYKNGTLHMVKALQLIEADPVAAGMK